MMINPHYAEIITQAKARNATHISFDKKTAPVEKITPEKDTFTLSDRALAKMNGESIKEEAPTYVKPKTANQHLTASSTQTSSQENSVNAERFSQIMQAILDKRLGVDREKLEELDAMMKEIAENENMSPEEKQKAIEELELMKEKVIAESIDNKKMAKQTFKQEEA